MAGVITELQVHDPPIEYSPKPRTASCCAHHTLSALQRLRAAAPGRPDLHDGHVPRRDICSWRKLCGLRSNRRLPRTRAVPCVRHHCCAACSRPLPLPSLPPCLSRAHTTARCAEAAHSPALAHALSQAVSSCSILQCTAAGARCSAACRARHAAAGHGAVAGCRVGRQRLARAASAAASPCAVSRPQPGRDALRRALIPVLILLIPVLILLILASPLY